MDKKYNNFITDLKHSNIKSNFSRLETHSEIIEFSLNQIKTDDKFTKNNLDRCKDAIADTLKTDNVEELINYYIKFGIRYENILSDVFNIDNIEPIRNIINSYSNITEFMKDTRIKNISIDINEKIKKLLDN